jgi:hypothetical protein
MTPRGRSPALIAAVAAVLGCAIVFPSLAAGKSGFDYNGIAHVSWWYNEYNNYDQPAGAATDSRAALAATGVNWAALLVTQYQDSATSTTIAPRVAENKTPTDDSLRFAIQELHGKGVKVMLKPHVDAWNGQWRGEFVPSDVAAWFASYTQFIVHYAQLAQELGVEGMVMGTEFVKLSGSANRDRWVAVIKAIRNVYGGVLAYAANATYPGDEFTSVSFWDEVDLIGLDAYFHLTNSTSPTLAELVSAWTSNSYGENCVAAVQNVASAHQKPIIFTELGYKSVDGANIEPWNYSRYGAYDPEEQRDLYEAAYEVWSPRASFMKGIFWWAWPVPAPGASDLDYNPRGKLAEAVLATWQGGTVSPKFALTATPASPTLSRGGSTTTALTITPSGGFTGTVALAASNLPTGVTAAFSPASTRTTSTLTLTASGASGTGTYAVYVAGTSGALSQQITLLVTVSSQATPSFALATSPASLTINPGGSGTSTVTITSSGGFTGSVALSASSLPAGVTATFNPASTTGSSTLTLAASGASGTGTSTVYVTGASGALSQQTTLLVTVNAPTTPSFALAASPSGLTINPGGSGTSTILITPSGGFTGSVALSASGLPSGVTATLNPASATGSSTLTLAASSTAQVGTATVIVTGTGGGLTRTVVIGLAVGAGADTQAPTAPGVPSASSLTSSSVQLTWSAATDNVAVTGYSLYQQSGASGILVVSSAATSTAVTGLSAQTPYTFYVVARDAAGNTSPASGTVTLTTPTAAPSGGCTVTFQINSQWSTGFTAGMVITNTGTGTLDGWTLSWDFAAGQTVARGWCANFHQSGSQVTVTNIDWNRAMAPGSSVNIGFVGGLPGHSNPVPSTFTLNGVPCG